MSETDGHAQPASFTRVRAIATPLDLRGYHGPQFAANSALLAVRLAKRWQRPVTAMPLGLDTPSIDFGQSTGFESHRILFDRNIPAFENVANLDQLPDTGFEVIALPMKIAGGSGGPLRIVARIR